MSFVAQSNLHEVACMVVEYVKPTAAIYRDSLITPFGGVVLEFQFIATYCHIHLLNPSTPSALKNPEVFSTAKIVNLWLCIRSKG